MTGGWIQKLSGVGEHRALRIRRLMIEKGWLEEAGSYRQPYHRGYPSGWRVTLFTLSRRFSGAGRWPKAQARPKVQASVRRAKTSIPWWKHPLFGLGTKSYPGSFPKRLKTWKEPPEWAKFAGQPLYS